MHWILIFLLYEILGILVPGRIMFGRFLKAHRDQILTDRELHFAHGGTREYVRDVDDGREAMEWRLEEINHAREKVEIGVFEFHKDDAGIELMKALYACAQRGVHVYILVDGISLFYGLFFNAMFRTLSHEENVEVRVYNPVHILVPWKTLFRMHDKYMIVDDDFFLIGGRNISSAFLSTEPGKKRKKLDYDLLVREVVPGQGNGIREIQSYFKSMWNSRLVKKFYCLIGEKKRQDCLAVYAQWQVEQYPELTELTWYIAENVSIISNLHVDHLYFQEANIMQIVAADMMQVDEVYLQSPYFIYGQEMIDTARALAKGRKVNLLTNAVAGGTNAFGCVDYEVHKDEIVDAGIRVYEFSNPACALHGKICLLDGNISYIGSCNVDMRSAYIDQEVSARIVCDKLNEKLRGKYEARTAYCLGIEKGRETTVGSEYQKVEMSERKARGYRWIRKCYGPLRWLM